MKKSFLWSLLAVMTISLVSFMLTACGDDEEDEVVVKPSVDAQNQGTGGNAENPTYTNKLQLVPNMTADYLSLYDAQASIELSGKTETVSIEEGMKIERTFPKGETAIIRVMSTPKQGISELIDKKKDYSISLFSGMACSVTCTDDKGTIVEHSEYSPDANALLTCSGLDIICNQNYYAYNVVFSTSEKRIQLSNNNSISHVKPVDITTGNAIDLGLSVLWASANVKTSDQYHGTSFYAWGETQVKDDYTWNTYKFYVNGRITKYNTTDGLTRLELSDDVAHVVMGGNWRMPTKAEMSELVTECTWTWVTYQGLKGYRVEGTNGNSIFLPACGHLAHNTIPLYGVPLGANKDATYWTSEIFTTTGEYPYQTGAVLGFNSSERTLDALNARMGGAAVRAVCPK